MRVTAGHGVLDGQKHDSEMSADVALTSLIH